MGPIPGGPWSLERVCPNPVIHSSDLAHNQIETLSAPQPPPNGGVKQPEVGRSCFEGLSKAHDILLNHNNVTEIGEDTFKGLGSLQVL